MSSANRFYTNKSIFIFVIIISFIVTITNGARHPECGESPTAKFKELAKSIGKPRIYYSLKSEEIYSNNV